MTEMRTLNQLSGGLGEVPIVITHIKPAGKREETIKQELEELNDLHLTFIFAEQAKLLEF